MIIKSGVEELTENLFRQLDSYWTNYDQTIIKNSISESIERLERILTCINKENHYVWKDDHTTLFSPRNSVQYAIFLYLLSNTLYKRGMIDEAEIVYYLNKVMHSCDWFYAIEFPEVFFGEHLNGSVMGRAEYGKRFFFYQGCTVGGNRNKDGLLAYPQIGKNVLMYSNSSILGNSKIGDNVIISANTVVKGAVIPNNSIVFGQSPNLIIKEKTREQILSMQSHIWENND